MLRLSVLAILSFVMVSSEISARAAEAPALTGMYKCVGKNPGGLDYEGTVKIVKKGEAYFLTWQIGPGDNYKGVGVVQENVLAVSYYGGISGVVAYKIESGGKLVGKWTIAEGEGAGQVMSEVLTPQ